MKKAAELGSLEAQHNLAVEYLEGTKIEKNEVKALAWFIHAGAHGFAHSNVNDPVNEVQCWFALAEWFIMWEVEAKSEGCFGEI